MRPGDDRAVKASPPPDGGRPVRRRPAVAAPAPGGPPDEPDRATAIHAVRGLMDDLDDVPSITQPRLIRQKSRDFSWHSPVLRERLRDKVADLVVCPRDEADVAHVLRACFARALPVTPRGAGTGTTGQAVPLRGGVVLDLSGLNRVLDAAPGRVRAGAGATVLDADRAARAASGEELRVHPTAWATATVGGFVAGGRAGVGSIAFGLPAEAGNVAAVRLVTMEAEPRVLELRGSDVARVASACGTTGVITEVELATEPARPWTEAVVAFAALDAACRFALRLATDDGIGKKLASLLAHPIPGRYIAAFDGMAPAGSSAVLALVDGGSLPAFEALAAGSGGAVVHRRAPGERRPPGLGPIHEYAFEHTTLQALRQDPGVVGLRGLTAPRDLPERAARLVARLGDEAAMHLEFVRVAGRPACVALPLVRYTTPERLAAIVGVHEEEGCVVDDPHALAPEAGGTGRARSAFRREADPSGLLNPGKAPAGDEPGDGAPCVSVKGARVRGRSRAG